MNRILYLRYISLIAVAFSFLGAGFMFYIGAVKTIKAFTIYFTGEVGTGVHQHLSNSSLTLISMLESLDMFLFALVLLIFAYGIFHGKKKRNQPIPLAKARYLDDNIKKLFQ